MLLRMLFAVSWNDIGRVLAVKLPKNEHISAAVVDLRVPVLPTSAVMNFDSQLAAFRKYSSGDRNVTASNGSITRCGSRPFSSIAVR